MGNAIRRPRLALGALMGLCALSPACANANKDGGEAGPSATASLSPDGSSPVPVDAATPTPGAGSMITPPDASSGASDAAATGSGPTGPMDAGKDALPNGAAGSPDASATTGDGGSACPGVPLVPDATGFIAPGSNAVGIHGSWFVYSDCVDLHGVNCATVTTPSGTGFANVGGKMCTSGMTSDATGAWGAGIGLELNDGPPQQPYDTVANGVTGFCFQLSGATIPSTSIRVAFPTQDNNDNAYFEAVTSPGVHRVLFSDTAQGSWVTTKVAFEPTKVMLMQFQIPSSLTASVPWDFCVDGVTAMTQ